MKQSSVSVQSRQAKRANRSLLSTREVAERLGISPNRVRQLISSGQLPAERVGKVYVVREGDLRRFARQPPGRRGKPRRAK